MAGIYILAVEPVLAISVKKENKIANCFVYSIHDKPDEDVLWLVLLLLL
jgi:hypothetical protein